ITEVTRLVPTGKVEPLGGVEVTLVTVQPLVAGKVHVTMLLLHCPGSALMLKSEGQGKLRQSVSITTWSTSVPLVPAVRTTDSDAGQVSSRQIVCATTQDPPKEVVSTVCCC